jgi:hypothetical protein
MIKHSHLVIEIKIKDLFDVRRGHFLELARLGEHAAETFKRVFQYPASFIDILFRKSDLKAPQTGASQRTEEVISDTAYDLTCKQCASARQYREEPEYGTSGNVFQSDLKFAFFTHSDCDAKTIL